MRAATIRQQKTSVVGLDEKEVETGGEDLLRYLLKKWSEKVQADKDANVLDVWEK